MFSLKRDGYRQKGPSIYLLWYKKTTLDRIEFQMKVMRFTRRTELINDLANDQKGKVWK